MATALEEELVDCALVVGMDRWAQKSHPRVVYNAKDLEKCAGSKYTSNAVLESIKDIIKDPKVKNIALVGTPCTVQAVGLLRKSSNEYAMKLAHKVRFLIGLFFTAAGNCTKIGCNSSECAVPMTASCGSAPAAA